MKKRGILSGLLIFVLILSTLAGCSTPQTRSDFLLYYVGTDSISIVPVDYKRPAAGDVYAQTDELIGALTTAVSGARSCVPPLGGVSLKGYSIDNKVITLDFAQEYLKLDVYEEISIRAAVVKTLVQLADIESVFFMVNGEPLSDASNNPVGGMTAETFADISANSLSNTKEAKLKLYYAGESGDVLVAEERNLYYKTAVSPERVVMEQILAGPDNEKHKAVVASGTKLLDISLKEGTCYVNLDATFAKGATGVSPEVTIYAIVDSLAELSNISKVQISIEADSAIKYMETVSLNQAFSRNLDLLIKE